MKKYIYLLFFLIYNSICSSQIDTILANKIDSMAKIDQYWRGMLRRIENNESDSVSLEDARRKVLETDSLNYLNLKQIFSINGYLGYSEVGEKSSNNFWLLVQHFDNDPEFQEEVLSKMKIEVEKDNASKNNYAYLVDRVKVNSNQLQVYGTQMQLNKDSSSYEPKPLIEPEKVNERRSNVSLPPIEKYIEMMNRRYFGSLKNE